MNNSDNIMLRPHKLALEDNKATIHIDSGDHIILKVYRIHLKHRYNRFTLRYWHGNQVFEG